MSEVPDIATKLARVWERGAAQARRHAPPEDIARSMFSVAMVLWIEQAGIRQVAIYMANAAAEFARLAEENEGAPVDPQDLN